MADFQSNQGDLEAVLESMSDAFFAVDKNWIVTRLNSQHAKTTQKTREEQLGRSLLDLFFTDPKFEDSIYLKSYRKAMRERVFVKFEDYYEPLDLWTEVRVYPQNDGGLAIFFTDIGERKRVELNLANQQRKLDILVSESASAIGLMRGPNLIFELVNKKWTELVSPRDYLGRTYEDVYPELVGTMAHKSLLDIFHTGKPFVAQEMKLLVTSPAGKLEHQYFDYSNVRILGRDGNPYGVYCHALNVTERVLGRDRLLESEQRLKEAVRARDEFLSIASHELKTPLTSLQLQAQLHRRMIDKRQASAYEPKLVDQTVDQAEKQAKRLSRLVDDMLDVARIQSGKIAITPEPLDFCSLLQEVLDRMGEQFIAVGLPIPKVANCPEATGSWDRMRIEQVIINLLTNAIRYGSLKPIEIEVTATSSRLHLKVIDQCLGIAAHLHEKIFDRFERAVNASEISGLGLGLFITKQIVAAHRGKIWVESELGKGSIFHVELPRHRENG